MSQPEQRLEPRSEVECQQRAMESVGGCDDRPAEDEQRETVGGPAAPGERKRTDVMRNGIRSVTGCCTRQFAVKPARTRLVRWKKKNCLFVCSIS